MLKIKILLLVISSILIVSCQNPLRPSSNQPLAETNLSETSGAVTIKGEIWVDNWFALYLGEELLIEDSVSISTERSFNAEVFTFKADYPVQLNVVMKDFKENDTGLEYIGAGNQQMGDGGFIAQFTEVEGNEIIAVSNADWKCLVIHQAPLDKSCEQEANPLAGEGTCTFKSLAEPLNWKRPNFDDSNWVKATIHSTNAVRPKDGYDQILWDSQAQLIWGSDLEVDNTILCRFTIDSP